MARTRWLPACGQFTRRASSGKGGAGSPDIDTGYRASRMWREHDPASEPACGDSPVCGGYLLQRQGCRYPRGQLAGVGHGGEFCQLWPVGADPDVVHARAAQGGRRGTGRDRDEGAFVADSVRAGMPTSAASSAASTPAGTTRRTAPPRPWVRATNSSAPRLRTRPCSASQAGAGGDVDRVHRRRLHPDPHLAGAGLRYRDVGYLQCVRAAVAPDDDGFHVISLLGAYRAARPQRHTLGVLLSTGKKAPESA